MGIVCKTLEYARALRVRQLVVDERRQRGQVGRGHGIGIIIVVHNGFLTTCSGEYLLVDPSVSSTRRCARARRCSRARDSRDITVPIGTPSALDASWYVSSSTQTSSSTSRSSTGNR